MLTLFLACSRIEPLDLPDDPAAAGVPVGVKTLDIDGVTVEVWYPASDAAAAEPAESADLMQFVPEVFLPILDGTTLPSPQTDAVRDAPLRNTDAALPVILFSHGFGGYRLQSYTFTTHLASRGYVVLAPDHPGRMLGDVLPCLLLPPLDGCDLVGSFTEDPAIDDLSAVLSWVEAPTGVFAERLDDQRIGAAGHSAGGGSVSTLAVSDARIGAVMPMAGAGAIERAVPALVVSGTCDGVVPEESIEAAWAGSEDAAYVRLLDAGHLAFSDICDLQLDQLAEDVLFDRDDLNEAIIDQLLALGTDGCTGGAPTLCEAWLPVEQAAPTLNHLGTVFFDASLLGTGEGDLRGCTA